MSKLAKRVDIHIGEKIRDRRTILGLTQEHLAAAIDISYQQVQKYETAANRVSGGRLFQIANALEVHPAFFFEGLDTASLAAPMEHGGKSRGTIELVANYQSISDPKLKSAVTSLAKTLSNRSRGRSLENAA